MKATLRFNLPEDQASFDYASNGSKAFFAIHNIRRAIIEQRDNSNNLGDDLVYNKILKSINDELEFYDILHLVNI